MTSGIPKKCPLLPLPSRESPQPQQRPIGVQAERTVPERRTMLSVIDAAALSIADVVTRHHACRRFEYYPPPPSSFDLEAVGRNRYNAPRDIFSKKRSVVQPTYEEKESNATYIQDLV